jgi:hypothetical protein
MGASFLSEIAMAGGFIAMIRGGELGLVAKPSAC